MKGHGIEIKINSERLYKGSPKQIFDDLREIGSIKISKNVGCWEVSRQTKDAIRNIKYIPRKKRLACICSAIEFDFDVEVYIDEEKIFSSIPEIMYIMTNLKEENNSLNISYFKNEIKRCLDQDIDIDVATSDYIKAKLIADIYEEYNIVEEEDPYI